MTSLRIPFLSSLFLFLSLAPIDIGLFAQTNLQVSGTRPAPEVFQFLVAPDGLMKEDQAIVESVLDQVEAWTVDSILIKERQHLSGIYGVVGRMMARYWQKLDNHKRKYIGTCSRAFKVYEGFAKEVDMNIFLMPHLEKYVDMARGGFDAAFEKGRTEKAYRYDNPDYPSAEKLKFKDLGYLTVECEGTPADGYLEQLAEVFIPTAKGKHDLKENGNFGVKYPSFGLYGPWVMDCNHNCRPEIHPIEWMWWLDMSKDRPGGENAKSWMVGMMRDDSKRFRDWVPTPVTGQISIPIAFPTGSKSVSINIQHLVVDTLFDNVLQEKLSLPNASFRGEKATHSFQIGSETALEVKLEGDLPGEGFRWWTGDFYSDPAKKMTFGELNIAVSAAKLYTGRITVDFQ